MVHVAAHPLEAHVTALAVVPADLIDELRWFPIVTPPAIASGSGQGAVAELRRRLGVPAAPA